MSHDVKEYSLNGEIGQTVRQPTDSNTTCNKQDACLPLGPGHHKLSCPDVGNKGHKTLVVSLPTKSTGVENTSK